MSWTELKSPSPPSLLSPAGPYCFPPITPPKKPFRDVHHHGGVGGGIVVKLVLIRPFSEETNRVQGRSHQSIKKLNYQL